MRQPTEMEGALLELIGLVTKCDDSKMLDAKYAFGTVSRMIDFMKQFEPEPDPPVKKSEKSSRSSK